MNSVSSSDSRSGPATPVAISLGSNLGDREGHLRFARSRLVTLLSDVKVSRIYETEPVHVTDQPLFLNACCVGMANLSAAALLEELKAIEGEAGREGAGPRYGPRSLDLDILLYSDEVVHTAVLQVPHPRMRERAFVLIPLAEISGDWRYPGSLDTVRDLAARMDATGVRCMGALEGLEADTEAG